MKTRRVPMTNWKIGPDCNAASKHSPEASSASAECSEEQAFSELTEELDYSVADSRLRKQPSGNGNRAL